MPGLTPFPAEIARSINDGGFGDRIYGDEEEWLARTVVDDLCDLGWRKVQWIKEPGSDFSQKLESPDGTRDVLVAAFTSPRVQVEIAVFRRRR